MSCRLSVIIPVYNVAQYLRECLSSVAKPRVEVIAVDDGSTDESGAILDGWQGIKVKDRDLRERMTEMWFDSLKDAAGLPLAPYQRFVLRLLAVTRSRLLSECLCHFPFALKQFLGRGPK